MVNNSSKIYSSAKLILNPKFIKIQEHGDNGSNLRIEVDRLSETQNILAMSTIDTS